MLSVAVWAMAPLIRAELGLSAAQFGWFVSVHYGVQAVCAFPAGALIDRFGVGRSLLVAVLIISCAGLCLSFVDSFVAALLAMALMGLGYSIVNPATTRGVFDWFPSAKRATAMGFKQTGVPLGGVLAAAGGVLATFLGWRAVLLLAAALSIVNFILLLPLLKIPRKQQGNGPLFPWKDVKRVVLDRNVRAFGFVNALLHMGQANFLAYLALFLHDVGRTSQSFSSICFGLAQLASTAGRIGWGVVCDRFFQDKRAVLLAMISVVAAMGLMAMALITPANVQVLALLLSMLLGVTIAAYAGLTLTIASEISPSERTATTVGYNLTLVSLGGVVGPPLFGFAMDYLGGYAAGWLLTGGLVAGGFLLIRFVFVERRGAQ